MSYGGKPSNGLGRDIKELRKEGHVSMRRAIGLDVMNISAFGVVRDSLRLARQYNGLRLLHDPALFPD